MLALTSDGMQQSRIPTPISMIVQMGARIPVKGITLTWLILWYDLALLRLYKSGLC
jgi:hypothetical protein